MVNKKLMILTGALVAIAAVAVLMDNKEKHRSTDDQAGKPLLKEADLTKVTAIELKDDNKTLNLKKDANGQWLIQEDDQFPAEASKVVKLLENLSGAKFIRSISRSKDKWTDLELDKNRHISLSGEGFSFKVTLGKNRTGGGQFVALGDRPNSYLLDQSLNLDLEPSNWNFKSIVKLKDEKIKGVHFAELGGDKALKFSREKKEDAFKLEGLEEKEKLKDAAVSGLKSILSSVNFTNKVKLTDEYKSKLASAREVVVSSFDNYEYKVKLVEIESSKMTTDAEGKEKKEFETKFYFHLTSTDPALSGLQKILETWQLEVSEYLANNFRKSRTDFVEKTQS